MKKLWVMDYAFILLAVICCGCREESCAELEGDLRNVSERLKVPGPYALEFGNSLGNKIFNLSDPRLRRKYQAKYEADHAAAVARERIAQNSAQKAAAENKISRSLAAYRVKGVEIKIAERGKIGLFAVLRPAADIDERACEQHGQHAERDLSLEVRDLGLFLFVHHAQINESRRHQNDAYAEHADKGGAHQ